MIFLDIETNLKHDTIWLCVTKHSTTGEVRHWREADSLQSYLDFYDQQLVKDAESIYRRMHPAGRESKSTSIANGGNLRPHYRALVTAYENEFIHNKGLQDEKLIDFFDTYVHDSLAGFAKDATLPSDPRVIYVGGDEKFKYAQQQSNDAVLKTA